MRNRHCIILFILACIINFFAVNDNNLYQLYYSGDFVQEEESDEDQVQSMDSQFFSPRYSDLETIWIRFSENTSQTETSDITVKLKDTEENILYEKTILNSMLTYNGYYEFDVGCKLEPQEQYVIAFSATGNPLQLKNFTPVYVNRDLTSRSLAGENNVFQASNSSNTQFSLDCVYVYRIINRSFIVHLFMIDLILVLIVLALRFINNDLLKKLSKIVIVGITPVLVFIVSEYITGNIYTVEPTYYITNILIYSWLLLIACLLFKKMQQGIVLMYIMVPLVALSEFFVHSLRGRSLMLQDLYSFGTAVSVLNQYRFGISMDTVKALFIMLTCLAIALWSSDSSISKRKVNSKWLWYRKTIGIGLVCVSIVLVFQTPIIKNSELFNINAWDIELSYRTKGLAHTFLGETQYLNSEIPDGYSRENVAEIYEKIEPNATIHNDKESPEIVIVIMNESWADFREINSFTQDDTITPFIDSLEQNVIKGKVSVPVFGAGTANTEYEFLTGNTMQFLNPGIVPYQFYTRNPEHGIVDVFNSYGYKSVALHPYQAQNWNRKQVYNHMGFDEYYALENWPIENPEILRWCVTDKAAYDAVIKTYEETDDKKLFMFLVTMQNHGGYEEKNYEFDDIIKGYPQASQYLSLIRETDKAFAYITDYFRSVNEKAMIVMFGDHYPNVEPEFYNMLFGTEVDSLSMIDRQKMYNTPVLIWTNYELKTDAQLNISTNFLGQYIVELAGLQNTRYGTFIQQTRRTIPIIGNGIIYDDTGKWQSMNDLTDNMQNVLSDYQKLQYRRVFDRGNDKQYYDND